MVTVKRCSHTPFSLMGTFPGPKEASIGEIEQFKALFLFPSFLAYMSVLIAASLAIIFYFGPKFVMSLAFHRYECLRLLLQAWKKEHALVYLCVQHDRRDQCQCNDWSRGSNSSNCPRKQSGLSTSDLQLPRSDSVSVQTSIFVFLVRVRRRHSRYASSSNM
jgi:hypothetical protein